MDSPLAEELAEDFFECINCVPGWAAGRWAGMGDYPSKWRDITQALLDVQGAAMGVLDGVQDLPRARGDVPSDTVCLSEVIIMQLREALDRAHAVIKENRRDQAT
ncbi:MAG TPA: hypothetical protein VIG24_03040 [Acidimicrobiia bacterium]